MHYEFDEYIKKKGAGTAIAIVLLSISVVFMLMSSLHKPEPVPEPDAFYGFDDPSYCYLDIVSISDWVYSLDDEYYYICEDIDDYMYVVQMDEERRNQLTYQILYWDEYDTMTPERVRIYGTPRLMDDDELDMLWDYMEYDDIDEVLTYFGENCLIENTVPEDDTKMVLLGASVLVGFFGIMTLLGSAGKNRGKIRKLQDMTNGVSYDVLENDFANTHQITAENHVRIGHHYLYLKKKNTVIPINAIEWVYQTGTVTESYQEIDSLTIMTADENHPIKIYFSKSEAKSVTDYLIGQIRKYNPNVLVGDTEENMYAYENRVDNY